MDFSLDVDPSLQSTPASTSSSASLSLEFFTQHDFDLFSDGLFSSPSMVSQTIEPSQLTDASSIFSLSSPSSPSSSSPSSSQAGSPSSTSDISVDLPSPPPHRSKKLRAQNAITAASALGAHTHAHGESPYDKDRQVKRHQTKLACTWCRKLSKKCDAQRPCSRCVQFDRCSECADAPPRKPRVKGVDRGTYKKTRDLAVVNYQEAVNKREAYVAKQNKIGRVVKVGLTADEILEKTRKEEARIQKENQKEKDNEKGNVWALSFVGAVSGSTATAANAISLQGGSMPFTGPLEDLFTCSASPETEELLFSSPPDSPAYSLLDVSSPTYASSATDYDESDLTSARWHWQTINQFPNVMELVAAAQAPRSRTLSIWRNYNVGQISPSWRRQVYF